MKLAQLSKFRVDIFKLARSRKFWVWLLISVIILTSIVVKLYPHVVYHPFSSVRRQNATIPVTTFKIAISPQESANVLDQPIPTTGCSTALPFLPGQSNFIMIKSGNVKRRFLMYLPPNFNNFVEHPLILTFHGYDDTPLNMERFSGLDTLAKNNGFIVVYPEGSSALGGVFGWNTGLHPTIRGNDVLFVSNMLNSLQANLCVNPSRIYATGFSNGGGFVGELACKMSNRIAAFAPVSGSYLSVFNSCDTTKAVPIMEIHGDADTTVPYLGLPKLKEVAAYNWVSGWAKRDGCSSNPQTIKESNSVTKYLWSGCHDNASVIHYKITGGKHVWPRAMFTEQLDGRNQNLNTAQLIWYFFNQHPLL